jgi:hypothetical protein
LQTVIWSWNLLGAGLLLPSMLALDLRVEWSGVWRSLIWCLTAL